MVWGEVEGEVEAKGVVLKVSNGQLSIDGVVEGDLLGVLKAGTLKVGNVLLSIDGEVEVGLQMVGLGKVRGYLEKERGR